MTTAFSMRSIEEVELQRSRWRRARKSLRLVDEEDECFATGGLGQRVPDLAARLLVLPFDPEANHRFLRRGVLGVVDLGAADSIWATRDRTQFQTHGLWSGNIRRTVILVTPLNLWDQFLALTRSASIDAGFGRHVGRINENGNLFFLINLVGRVWSQATRYTEVVGRFKLAGPFEVTLRAPSDGWRLSGQRR